MPGFFIYNDEMNALLRLNHIGYALPEKVLLHNIDLALVQGEILGLLGVNGAGKSTVLKIVAGALLPTSGSITSKVGSSIGYLPDRPPLISSWRVKRFLYHICHLHRLSARHRAVERVVAQCSLSEVLEQPIASLSKGNRQRVALAQAFIHQPSVLILDEPASGLDPEQMLGLRKVLRSIKAQTAIVLSSHLMQEVSLLCDHAIVIDNGHQLGQLALIGGNEVVIEFAEPLSLRSAEQLPYWQSGAAHRHYFATKTQSMRDRLIQQCVRQGLSISRISGSEQMLEERFLTMIGRGAEKSALTVSSKYQKHIVWQNVPV